MNSSCISNTTVAWVRRALAMGALFLGLFLALLPAAPALAVFDGYEFESEVQRQRYLSFIEEMRCPKCQNQNLAGSDSPIAADLRRQLYELLQEGKSDKEIVDYMVARYGEYVLYRPKVTSNTLMLWGLPAVLLLLGLGAVGLTLRQRRRAEVKTGELKPGEDARLQKLLQAAEARERMTEYDEKDSEPPGRDQGQT